MAQLLSCGLPLMLPASQGLHLPETTMAPGEQGVHSVEPVENVTDPVTGSINKMK